MTLPCCECGDPVEAEHYIMCKKCWWDQDPRNVKNGGTVDLSKRSVMDGTVTTSLNNRFLVEPYSGDRALKAKTTSGFAVVQQKTSLVGLRLLADADVAKDGFVQTFNKGAIAYIKEELLFTQPWAQKVFESEGISGKFIIVDSIYVDFVVQP